MPRIHHGPSKVHQSCQALGRSTLFHLLSSEGFSLSASHEVRLPADIEVASQLQLIMILNNNMNNNGSNNHNNNQIIVRIVVIGQPLALALGTSPKPPETCFMKGPCDVAAVPEKEQQGENCGLCSTFQVVDLPSHKPVAAGDMVVVKAQGPRSRLLR